MKFCISLGHTGIESTYLLFKRRLKFRNVSVTLPAVLTIPRALVVKAAPYCGFPRGPSGTGRGLPSPLLVADVTSTSLILPQSPPCLLSVIQLVCVTCSLLWFSPTTALCGARWMLLLRVPPESPPCVWPPHSFPELSYAQVVCNVICI